MNRILKDVKRIIVLARKAHTYLVENKIRVAKRELNRIIRFDVDELTRLQKEHGDQRLIEDCSIILKDAKNALRSLDFNETSEEAKRMIEEIMKLDGLELIQINDEEKVLNDLYVYWKEVIQKKKYYHGTSNLSVPQIKKYGLVPTMKPFFWGEFQRLYQLYQKAGVHNPLRLIHFDFKIGMTGMVDKGVFITSSYAMAKNYATKSPSIWHEFVGQLNQDQARRKFLLESFFEGELPKSYRSLCEQIYDSNPRDFYEKILNYFTNERGLTKELICRLSKDEVYELQMIFEKLWAVFKKQKPVILHISVLAPAIAEEEPFKEFENHKSAIYDFHSFVNFFKYFTHDLPLKEAIAKFENTIFDPVGYQIVVQRSIPKKFIKIEYL